MKENDILITLCRLFNAIADTAEIIGEHIRDIKKVNKREEIAPHIAVELIEKLNEATLNNTKTAANELFWIIMAKRKQEVDRKPGE